MGDRRFTLRLAGMAVPALVLLLVSFGVPSDALAEPRPVRIEVIDDKLIMRTREKTIRIVPVRDRNRPPTANSPLVYRGVNLEGRGGYAFRGTAQGRGRLVFDHANAPKRYNSSTYTNCFMAVTSNPQEIVPVLLPETPGGRNRPQPVFSLSPISDYLELKKRIEDYPDDLAMEESDERMHRGVIRDRTAILAANEAHTEDGQCKYIWPAHAPRPAGSISPEEAEPIAWERAGLCLARHVTCERAGEIIEAAIEDGKKKLRNLRLLSSNPERQAQEDRIIKSLSALTEAYGSFECGQRADSYIDCPDLTLLDITEGLIRICSDLSEDEMNACASGYYASFAARFFIDKAIIQNDLTASYRAWRDAVAAEEARRQGQVKECEDAKAWIREAEGGLRAVEQRTARLNRSLPIMQREMAARRGKAFIGDDLVCKKFGPGAERYRRERQEQWRQRNKRRAGNDTVTSVTCTAQLVAENSRIEPVVRTEPRMPSVARRRGLSGSVTVRFTVAADGTVKDTLAVDSTNSIFDGAARRAVLDWRYEPKMVDGVAVERPCVEVTLDFKAG